MPNPTGKNQFRPRVTRQHQAAFLEVFAETGFANVAAEQLGLSVRNVFLWSKRSPTFAKKYEQAKQTAREVRGARVLHRIWEKIQAGACDGPVSNLMMFLAKQADPSFRDNAEVKLALIGPSALFLSVSDIRPNMLPAPPETTTSSDAEAGQ